ncbi:MAG: hypothetical protein HYV63_32535 [Candidatus Schekmanbacteria bacterium]|nr:hypothetical protein [Candidatus Schekmanbacteria bacterium]
MLHQQDSVWKDLLDRDLEPFLAFFFPAVHADVDWSRAPEALDKEFRVCPAWSTGDPASLPQSSLRTQSRGIELSMMPASAFFLSALSAVQFP